MIFTSWIKFLSKLLGDLLICWLLEDIIRSNLPESFEAKYRNTICIIDSTEIYNDLQAKTWSDYKKHNTISVLVAIAPSRCIMFFVQCLGRKSIRLVHLPGECLFHNLLERDDEVMADRGFQIQNDLLHYYCKLSVPSGALAKSQMTSTKCKKTKGVANLRTHIGRVINQIKTFRITLELLFL